MAGMPSREFFSFIMAMAPYLTVYFVTEPRAAIRFRGFFDWPSVLGLCGVWLGASAAILTSSMWSLRAGFSRWRLGRLFRWRRRSPSPVGQTSARGNRRRRFVPFAIFEGNPIVWRDRRANVYDPDGSLLRVQLGVWIMAVIMIGLFFSLRPYLLGWVVGPLIAFLHIAFASVGGSSLAGERQRGSMDLLLLTNIRPRSIVFGALLGVFWCVLPTIALIGVSLVAIGWQRINFDAFT
jgi:hypothetical protein